MWHWLIVLVVTTIIVGSSRFRRKTRRTLAGIHAHSATQYICAALHTGKIDPQSVIDRLQDRHKAKLPELGLNTPRILAEARHAQRRKLVWSIGALILSLWLLEAARENWPDPENLLSLEPFLGALVYSWLALALLGLAETLSLNNYLRTKIIPSVDAPDDTTGQNVIIFGGFSPFAGYGIDLDGWSFTVDASKGSIHEAAKPQQFEQIELLDHLSYQLEKNVVLGDSHDKLFVNGLKIRHNKLFLFDAKAIPNTFVSASTMKKKIGTPDNDARHYRLFSVPLADGHLFLTFFIRSTMVGNNLFIESRCFILTPIRPEFTGLNEMPVKKGFKYHTVLVCTELLLAPFKGLGGTLYVLDRVSRIPTLVMKKILGDPQDKEKATDEAYNYGQTTSLRESWSSGLYHTYFQMLDKDMINKTCQHIIVNGIVDFLDRKGVATDDIKERRTQIFNSGVIVAGGVVNTQQMAVGTGASVQIKLPANPASAGKKGAPHVK